MRQYELVDRVRRYNPHTNEDLLRQGYAAFASGDLATVQSLLLVTMVKTMLGHLYDAGFGLAEGIQVESLALASVQTLLPVSICTLLLSTTCSAKRAPTTSSPTSPLPMTSCANCTHC